MVGEVPTDPLADERYRVHEQDIEIGERGQEYAVTGLDAQQGAATARQGELISGVYAHAAVRRGPKSRDSVGNAQFEGFAVAPAEPGEQRSFPHASGRVDGRNPDAGRPQFGKQPLFAG